MNIFKDDEHLATDNTEPPSMDEPEPRTGASQWVALASQAYHGSTDWWHANYYRQWERNLALFRNEHPSGSKYNTDVYKHRSRIFRPKTRSAVRRNEAAAALAFFGSDDVVAMQAEDENDPHAVLAAEVRKELLNYRLTNPDPNVGIPWFQTVMGAYQEAMVMGAVCSHQYWEFVEREEVHEQAVMDEMRGAPMIEPLSGEPVISRTYERRVVRDRPVCELVPLENIRFDPASNWLNPVESSPYVVHLMPMFVTDVRERMLRGDSKTAEPPWFYLDDAALSAARQDRYNSVRQARQGSGRQDPYHDDTSRVSEFEVVWVHKNIVRRDGEDWLFYTLGAQHLLSEPVRLSEVYWHGMRPYTFGSVLIESHRSMPASPVQLAEQIQTHANDIANQRIDNVKLVLNKRYFIKRGGNVDVQSLIRNVPGSATAMEDPKTDVEVVSTPDVTASSYQEQDRLNLDFDESIGTFSPGSVQSNRQMNETVGGMNLISQDANTITEYSIRVFAESWMQPTLTQMDALEVHYESDRKVLQIAGQRSAQWQRLQQQTGVQAVTPEMVRGRVALRVRVGYGATNPTGRIEKLSLALNTLAGVAPGAMARIKEDEIVDEVLGILGYQGAERFFERADSEQMQLVAQLQQQLQEMEMALASKQAEREAELQMRMAIEQAGNETSLTEAQLRARTDLEIAEKRAQVELAKHDARPELIAAERKSERDAAVRIEQTRMGNEQAEREGRRRLMESLLARKAAAEPAAAKASS